MTTIQLVTNRFRAIKGIGLSSVWTPVMALVLLFSFAFTIYVAEIPRLIAATLAEYIGIVAG